MTLFTSYWSVSSESEPFEIRRQDGSSVWWSRGSIITVKLRSEETGWPIALAEQICPPGYATPLHVHYEHDEVLLAREGDIDIYYGTDPAELTRTSATSGDAVFLPKGAPHGFHNTSEEPRALYILFESPLEQGFLEAGVPVETPAGGLPSAPKEILDSERVGTIDEKYATDALRPLPIDED